MQSNQVIVVDRFGGIGNRLTMMANAVAYSLEHDCRVICPALYKFSNDFVHLRENLLGAYPPPGRRHLINHVPGAAALIERTRLLQHLVNAFIKVNGFLPASIPNTVVADEQAFARQGLEPDDQGLHAMINGVRAAFLKNWYFRCPDLVMRHSLAIRNYLKPVSSIESEAEEIVSRLKGKADLVIGTHIRQCDYKNFRNGRFFYSILQYHDWMSQLAEAVKPLSAAFLVCSDAEVEPEHFAGLTVETGPGYPIGDIEALSRCDRIIGPLSTFNQWASFYGDTPLHTLDPDCNIPWHERFGVSDLSVIP